jgi:hypothetical protein
MRVSSEADCAFLNTGLSAAGAGLVSVSTTQKSSWAESREDTGATPTKIPTGAVFLDGRLRPDIVRQEPRPTICGCSESGSHMPRWTPYAHIAPKGLQLASTCINNVLPNGCSRQGGINE